MPAQNFESEYYLGHMVKRLPETGIYSLLALECCHWSDPILGQQTWGGSEPNRGFHLHRNYNKNCDLTTCKDIFKVRETTKIWEITAEAD
ncbi:hypothetical protein QQF64_011000 [Cirrhinus molitorella]|uniref:Uncharacterized protein n=1 Tax=Cirrhinus molitorella TaxID=172907 RepID=A0ABR3M0F8_9TELE